MGSIARRSHRGLTIQSDGWPWAVLRAVTVLVHDIPGLKAAALGYLGGRTPSSILSATKLEKVRGSKFNGPVDKIDCTRA
jgi:hypothetical protein